MKYTMEHSFNEEGPGFDWPHRPTEQHNTKSDVPHHGDHHVKIDDVVTTVKNVINTILNNQTESDILPSTTSSNPMINFDETSSTTDAMVGIQEKTNSSIVTEIFQNNNTVLNPNTIFTEMSGSNNTVVTPDDGGVGATENTTNFITDTISAAVDTAVTTTERIITTISDVVTTMVSPTTEDETSIHSGQHDDNIEDNTLYIVLGVILGGLLLIMIILIIIYKRYKIQYASRSGVYCVTDLNEISISSTNQKEINPGHHNVQ